ncbi:MAG: hypothetical protein KF722_18835 [Nitrospira sp.]|nr:hypothetical protein [Nitrospira sp.]
MKLIVREYVTAEGINPFRRWLNALDVSVRARVQARIFRFETGDKASQRKDIGLAQRYWADYLEMMHHGKDE